VSGTKRRGIVIVSDTMNGFFFSTFPYLVPDLTLHLDSHPISGKGNYDTKSVSGFNESGYTTLTKTYAYLKATTNKCPS
jgi:hypothetical protein